MVDGLWRFEDDGEYISNIGIFKIGNIIDKNRV